MSKTRADYEAEIIELSQFSDQEKKLNYRLSKWFELSNIIVHVANNEQKPWTSHMIGYPCEPMLTKKESGCPQVGDYIFFINGQVGSLLVERKSLEDMFGTLFSGRERFYREIERYEKDERFDSFYIIVEGSLLEFLEYRPYNPRTRRYITTFSAPQKLGSVAGLLARGVQIVWAGNENVSARLYGAMIRHHCLKNWARYIGVNVAVAQGGSDNAQSV